LKETKRVKTLLTEKPEDFQAIIEGTPLAICITNEDAHFVAVNDNYCKLYGYTREQLVGNHFAMVLPEENKQALSDYHARFFVDKYEIIRKWVVRNNNGQLMEIFADAGYNDKIQGRPHKVTMIQFMKYLEEMPTATGYAHKDIH
jgi:PAS domain S-box-containing protein